MSEVKKFALPTGMSIHESLMQYLMLHQTEPHEEVELDAQEWFYLVSDRGLGRASGEQTYVPTTVTYRLGDDRVLTVSMRRG